MDDPIKKILEKRRDKAIATILGFKDDYCEEFLPDELSKELRKVVLDQINDYYDLCCDLLRSVQPEGVILNENWLNKIDEMHTTVMSRGY